MSMTFDPRPWRRATAAASAGRIHLNNAGASLMPQPVIQAVTDHLRLESELGGYEAADAAASDIEAAYESVARLLGAQPRNVAFVENATAAYAQALSAFDFEPGDAILTSTNDYVSNQLAFLSLARRRGVRVIRAADLPEGGIDPAAVRDIIGRDRPRLVAVTWVPTNSGLVQPVGEVGAACREAGVPFLVDACQAVGQLDIDVDGIGCDFLSATARKFLRGPRGAGFLYVADRVLDGPQAPLYIDLRGARWTGPDTYEPEATARRFENWEFAWALVLGTGAAARYALDVGVAAAGAYAAALAEQARQLAGSLPGARVLDQGTRRAAIATVAFAGHDAATIVERLREQAINIGQTRRDYAVIDLDRKGVSSALRISPHYYNDQRDIETLASALEEFAAPA
jgi:selenocysteine lyase/cysteine desulfurase